MFAPSLRRARATLIAGAAVFAMALLAPVASAVDVSIATIPAGVRPNSVAVNPLSRHVYVGNLFGDRFSIIDGTTDSVVTSFPVGNISCLLVNTTVTPARTYVGDFAQGWLYVVNDSTRSIIATLTGFGGMISGPRALALEPGGGKLYVAEYGNDRVAVLDASTYAVLTRVSVGDTPRALGIYSAKNHKRLFVANRTSNDVTIIDAKTDSVVASVAVGGAPKAIAVDTSSAYAYVTNENSDTVSVIDDTDALLATIGVGDRPVGIAVDTVGGRVFVANYLSNNVTVIRTSDRSIEATLAVQGGPFGVAIDAATRKVYVSNAASGSVSVIDPSLAVTTVATERGPIGIGVDSGVSPAKVYVANETSNSVSVIQDNGASIARTSAARAAADGDVIAVTVDPVAPGSVPTTLTGSAASNRPPGFEAAVVAVWARVDGAGEWRQASITGGAGTTSVTWALGLQDPLDEGPHTVQVVAFDETGAAAATSDAGSASQNPQPGGSVVAQVDVSVAQATVTTLAAVVPPSGAVRQLAVSVRTVGGEPVPGGFVAVQRWTARGWRWVADVALDPDGSGLCFITTPGTYRGRFLGYPGYEPSVSAQLVVRSRPRRD